MGSRMRIMRSVGIEDNMYSLHLHAFAVVCDKIANNHSVLRLSLLVTCFRRENSKTCTPHCTDNMNLISEFQPSSTY